VQAQIATNRDEWRRGIHVEPPTEQ
jgi:hypothetical protein